MSLFTQGKHPVKADLEQLVTEVMQMKEFLPKVCMP